MLLKIQNLHFNDKKISNDHENLLYILPMSTKWKTIWKGQSANTSFTKTLSWIEKSSFKNMYVYKSGH